MMLDFLPTELAKDLFIAMLATFLPSPTDPINFYLQNWLYTHKPRRWIFELIEIFNWYILDALWYALLFIIVIIMNINYVTVTNQITLIATLIGFGATISIVWRFLTQRTKR